jgi:hypothetical protein
MQRAERLLKHTFMNYLTLTAKRKNRREKETSTQNSISIDRKKARKR